jgi:hypothetical protein
MEAEEAKGETDGEIQIPAGLNFAIPKVEAREPFDSSFEIKTIKFSYQEQEEAEAALRKYFEPTPASIAIACFFFIVGGICESILQRYMHAIYINRPNLNSVH